MKIKGISALLALALVFGFSILSAQAVEVEIGVEASFAACSDGVDNDDDTAVDEADADCADFLEEEPAQPELVPENTDALCNDGLDNDDDTTIDAADSDCAAFFAPAEPELVENTDALCRDGLDNDDDTTTDAADADCAAFYAPEESENPTVVPENTAELCSDGLDNDDDTTVDAADADCAPFVNPGNNGGNNGGDNGSDDDDDDDDNGSRSSRSGQKKSSSRPSSQGEVLGAFSGSCPFITGYMRLGWANDVEQVKKLQEFLNEELNISLPVTGFFGELTYKAVSDFQLKYKDDVLKPWVDAGLHESENDSTGFVYITTSHKINEIVCPDFDEKLPALVPASN